MKPFIVNMIPSAFWPEKKLEAQGYRSIDTDSIDCNHNQHDDQASLPGQNVKNKFDAESALERYNHEERIKHIKMQDHSVSLQWGKVFVCGNVCLFLISLSLFVCGNRRANRPNNIYRQLTSYCKQIMITDSRRENDSLHSTCSC